MRRFNENYVLKEIEKNYHNSFPGKKIETIILSYKFKNDKTGYITSFFFCLDPDHELIGFAIHYGFNNILRFYNYEGEDMGLEIDMLFKSIKEYKAIKKIKVEKEY